MKWIKASERLPELGKEVIWRWGNVSGSYVEVTDWCKDLQENCYIRTENLIDLSDADNEYYWLDETPEDWESLEKKFNEDFSTLTDKPMVGYDIIQWFRDNV